MSTQKGEQTDRGKYNEMSDGSNIEGILCNVGRRVEQLKKEPEHQSILKRALLFLFSFYVFGLMFTFAFHKKREGVSEGI